MLIVGSEVPNLFEPGAASTLVVSKDVDIGIPVARHAAVKARLAGMRGLRPSPEEPSVWLPDSGNLLEVNFLGMDSTRDPTETYVLADDVLPLMVFGPLCLLEPGPPIEVDGMRVPVPRLAGLVLEKLVTDRTGEKGDRDLLVVLGLLLLARPEDLDELATSYRRLSPELRHGARSHLTILSLMAPRPNMPDPEPERRRIADLLRRLEATE